MRYQKNYPVKGKLEWLAFDAGNDILCFAEHISEGIEMIQINATDNQIDQAFKRVWELKEKAIKAEVEIQKELSNPDILNEEIAKNCITFCNGDKREIIALREKGFVSISNIQNTDNLFITLLKEHFNFKCNSITEESIKSIKRDINSEESILLSLFPPQVKPTDNFGFTKTEIQFINELISSKNVVLYLFGNPYALRVFNYENASAVVLAYQEFKEFQKVAAAHFMGSVIAEGKLPVVL